MATGRRRISRVLFLSALLLAATAVFGLLYFVQIERNEEYQNQLHFRELNEIGTGLSEALSQLSKVADVSKDSLQTSLDILDALKSKEITSVIPESTEESYQDAFEKEDQLWIKEDEIDELINEYIDSVLNGFDDYEKAGLVADHCSANEDSIYCNYFARIYDELTYEQMWWENLYNEEQQAFPDVQIENWTKEYKDLAQQIKNDKNLLSTLGKLAAEAQVLQKSRDTESLLSLERRAIQLCSTLSEAICKGLMVKAPQRQQVTKKSRSNENMTVTPVLLQLEQQQVHLKKLLEQQTELLDLFAVTWRNIADVLNGNSESDDPLIIQLSKLVSDAKTLESQLDAEEERAEDPLRNLWIKARTNAIQTVDALRIQHGWGRISEDNLYSRAANLLRDNIKYQQPETPEDIKELDDFLTAFRQDYAPSLLRAQLRQRVRLANGGETLTNLTLSRIQSNDKNKQTSDNPCDANRSEKLSIGLFRHLVKAGISDLCFSVPTSDLLEKNISRFPLVIVADGSGLVLARASTIERTVDPADLQFEKASGLYKALVDKQNLKDAETPHFSGILEQDIGGIAYRIFIQPVNPTQALFKEQKLFIVGLVPAQELRFAKLSVSPSTAMWFVLGVVAIMAAVPLIKVRFVSIRYCFSRADISQLGLGTLILVGVLAIGISDQLFFSYFKESKIEQARHLHSQISEEFEVELNSILSHRPAVTGQLSNFDSSCIQRFNYSHSARKQTQGSDYVYFKNCDNEKLKIVSPDDEEKIYYLLEGSFSLDARGVFQTSGESGMMSVDELAPSRWLHPGLYIANDLNLSSRGYFKQATSCEYPYQDVSESCRQGYTLERIANVRDGRKSTQFGFSEFDSLHDTQANRRAISSIGTRLRTFLARVMPNNFGFMVFDKSGKVLYHSEDERALLENVFVETDNNPQLRTLVNYQSIEENPVAFDTLYRDQQHMFLTAQLHAELPWYLVVYHSQSPTLNSNMLLVFISISLFIVIVAPLFLWSRYGTDQNYWRRWIVYSPENASLYCRFGWWSAGMFLFSVMAMGLIHELSIRLLLWLILIIMLLARLNVQFMPKRLQRLTGTHPVIPFFVSLMLMLIVSGPELRNVAWGNSFGDVVAFFLGIATLVLFIWIGWKHSNRPTRLLFNRRYPRSYVWYLVSLIWLFGVLPALLVVNSANKYLLHHQAHLDSTHLEVANNKYHQEVASYLELMRVPDPQRYHRTDWLGKESLEQLYPAAKAKSHLAWVVTPQVSIIGHQADRADLIISRLVRLADIGGSINAELHYLAKLDNDTHHHQPVLNYDADKFLLSASISQYGLITIVQILLLLAAYKIVRLLFIHKLMGEHLPANYRENDTQRMEQRITWFESNFKRIKNLRVQLIRSTPERAYDLFTHRLGVEVFSDKPLCIQDCLQEEDGEFLLVKNIKNAHSNGPINLLLSGLDDLAFHRQQRQLGLKLLSKLHSLPRLNIVLLCDVAPLFRLCKPEAYPGIELDELTDQSEMLAWANLLYNFEKEYDWSPSVKRQLPVQPSPTQVLDYECQGWPQLAIVGEIFTRYNATVKCNEYEKLQANKHIDVKWEQDQIIEFFAAHAGALYRQKWQQCTKDEKLMLYQVANGDSVNPMNVEVLEHLVRRGYLFRDQGWHLVNLSFKRFILSAENEADMAEWQEEAKDSIWQMLKIPIMIVVLVLVALILLGTGEGLESILGILSAMLGIIPLLLRNVSAFGQTSMINGE